MEILAGYNLVVDSNVSSPSTFSPSAATVAARVCNTSGRTINNVVVNIANTVTSGGGAYLFDKLADGKYLVLVDTETSNTSLPNGYSLTTDKLIAVDLGDPANTLNPVPRFDTFNADLLEFVSADPALSGSSTGGSTPYANAGSLSWSNIGLIYAGGTKSVTVTFKGLDPGTGAVSVTNAANVTGAKFVTGEPANNGEGDAVHNLAPTGSIGDIVWNNNGAGGGTAGNAVQDGTETGIPFVQVILYDSTGTTPLITTTTSVTGYYLFEGWVAGNYVVKVTPSTILGGSGTPNYDLDGGNDNQSSVTLALDEARVDADFGYTVPAVIFGNVWEDWNKDSLQDPGDNGFAGVKVELNNGSCTLGSTCPSTTVDSTGAYSFTNVAPGSYTIVVTPPTGFNQTLDPDETGGVCSTCDSTKSAITVAAGEIYGNYNFAYGPNGAFSIGDTVYTDWDGDGSQSAAEFGIPNITVTLYEERVRTPPGRWSAAPLASSPAPTMYLLSSPIRRWK